MTQPSSAMAQPGGSSPKGVGAWKLRAEQFTTLINQAPLGVYLVDADFKIRDVNTMARPVFGDLADKGEGMDFATTIRHIWEPAYAAEVIEIFRRVLETGEPYATSERAEMR